MEAHSSYALLCSLDMQSANQLGGHAWIAGGSEISPTLEAASETGNFGNAAPKSCLIACLNRYFYVTSKG
jgi:hypothetical protein